MKLSHNQIFLSLFFIFSLLVLFLNLRDASLILNPYTFGGWVITYTNQGITKILGGELLFFLNNVFSIHITSLFILVNLLLYFFIIFALTKKYFFLADDIKILSLFFPTSFIFLILEPGLVGRLEVVFFSYISIIYLFFKSKKKYIPGNYFYLLNGFILGILLLFHESFFTFTPLLFLLINKYLKITYNFRILVKNFLLFYSPQLLFLILIFYCSPGAGQIDLDLIFQKLPIDISNALSDYCSSSGAGYICFLNKTQEEISWTFTGLTKFFFISSLFFNIFINSLFLIFIFSLQKFKLKKIDYLIILYLFIYLFTFVKTSDWARYFFIQNMIFLLFLNEDKVRKINIKIFSFLVLLMSLMVIPHGVHNKFSMGLITTSNFLTNKFISLINMINL